MQPDDLLREYRSLECRSCHRHFGYQHRSKTELVYCASECIETHVGCFPGPGVAPPDGEFVVSRDALQPISNPEQKLREQEEAISSAQWIGSGAPTVAQRNVRRASFTYGLRRDAETEHTVPLAEPIDPVTKPTVPVTELIVSLTKPTVRVAPSRKKYMLEQLAHTDRIQPNGYVLVSYAWSKTRYLVVGLDFDTEGPKLQAVIEQQLESCEELGDCGEPVLGEVLLAPWSEGLYYRGVVKMVDLTEKTVTVEFIDYGDRVRCRFDEIRLPNEEIMQFPVLGLSVSLPDVSPCTDGQNIGAASDYFDMKMQMQMLDTGVEKLEEDADVALWISGGLTLNTVVHKMAIE